MATRYFPQGIARDHTFCNREKERSLLKKRIETHEHTVLVAPRRYGKTSLLAQLLEENDFPGCNIDFFFVLNQTDVCKLLTHKVSELIKQLMPKNPSAIKKLLQVARKLNPKLTLSMMGQTLEISSNEPHQKGISDLLLTLDFFAEKAKKSCVLIFDEFQQIGELRENHAVEAAIRHAVERSKNVSYIFCGSKRHLLNEMFSNRSRPLYHLCDLMSIDRIETESYTPFLHHLAQKKWRKKLHPDAVKEILDLTENHPYYVNALCRRLWHENKSPTLQTVRQTWDEYVLQQSPWIISDISSLTLNRKKIALALASHSIKEPQSMHFINLVHITAASIKKALDYLMKSDLVFKDAQGYYRILDPSVKYFLNSNRLS